MLELQISLKVKFDGGRIRNVNIANYSGPGAEDCVDKNGIPVVISGLPASKCYGNRDKQIDGDRYTKCGYGNQDTPNFAVGRYIQALMQQNPNAPRVIGFSLKLRWRFLVRIVDTCNNNNTIFSATLEKECQFEQGMK